MNGLQKLYVTPYLTVNAVFFVVLSGVLIYFAFFSAERNHYPIPGSLEILDAGKDISSGLSHSLSEILRGRFDSAREFNEHGLRIFFFFLLQWMMRPAFSILYLRHQQSVFWIRLDAGTSIILFILTFFPFLERFAEVMNLAATGFF